MEPTPPAAVAETPATVPIQNVPVSLNNPVAIRVALIVSPLTVLASVLPLVNILFLVWWVAAGWLSVRLYGRITGARVTVNAGARLGWIIGLLSFIGLSAVLAITYTLVGKQIFQDMVRQNPQMASMLNDPTALLIGTLFGVLIFFVTISSACAAGGALGARFRSRP